MQMNEYSSKSSQALYKFYLSQFLWKKRDLKESYAKALEAVKLYLAMLKYTSCQSINSVTGEEATKCLNLAGTQIQVKSSYTNVGLLDDLRQAAECLCWLGELCDKVGCISEAEVGIGCCCRYKTCL